MQDALRAAIARGKAGSPWHPEYAFPGPALPLPGLAAQPKAPPKAAPKPALKAPPKALPQQSELRLVSRDEVEAKAAAAAAADVAGVAAIAVSSDEEGPATGPGSRPWSGVREPMPLRDADRPVPAFVQALSGIDFPGLERRLRTEAAYHPPRPKYGVYPSAEAEAALVPTGAASATEAALESTGAGPLVRKPSVPMAAGPPPSSTGSTNVRL